MLAGNPVRGRDRDHCRASPEIDGDEVVRFAFRAAGEVGATGNGALVVIGIGSGRLGRAAGHTRGLPGRCGGAKTNIQLALAPIVRAAGP
jgi:hypothetical protein